MTEQIPNRRTMIRSLAAGGLLLPGVLSDMLSGATTDRTSRESTCAEAAALCAEGEARDLSLHDGRRVACR